MVDHRGLRPLRGNPTHARVRRHAQTRVGSVPGTPRVVAAGDRQARVTRVARRADLPDPHRSRVWAQRLPRGVDSHATLTRRRTTASARNVPLATRHRLDPTVHAMRLVAGPGG